MVNMEDISYILPSISLAKLFYHYGLLDQMIERGFVHADEDYYCMFIELLDLTADAVWMDYDENYDVNKWYFSNKNMQEYYRLCREYSKKHHVSLKNNPFIREAERYVDCSLNFGSCGYAWWLNTGINHEWASGIVFRTDCYFNGERELLEALLDIRAWYDSAVSRLKSVLEEKSVLPFPKHETRKEVLAA